MGSTDLGTLIRRAREGAGVSQRSLAVRAGTSQAWISRVESGRVAPSLEAAGRLALALGFELVPQLQPLPGHDLDARHRASWRALSDSERLQRGLAWAGVGGQLHGAAGARGR